MRSKGKELKQKIVELVDSFFDQHYRTPSLAEVGDALDITKQTVMRYLREMTDEGTLEYNGKTILTRHVRDMTTQHYKWLPVSGTVPCGDPQTEEEQTDSFVEIPTSMLGDGKYFVLIADGDSMIDAGITDGDLVIVRQTTKADYNKIVVALDEDNRSTLKRLMYDEELRQPYLHPENPEYEDIYPDVLTIQGVAEKVIKDV